MCIFPNMAKTSSIPDAARRVGDLFEGAGFELFVVGGAVRDGLLGLDSFADDIDMTTNARPPDILKIVEPIASAVWRQGERFGTIGVNLFDRVLEITTYRSETYDSDSRKPVVGFGDDLKTDLSRRDFTINAMARSARTGELHDPFGGKADLANRILRTPLAPDVSFGDDPLRMLRAARFAARLDLTMDDGVVTAAVELADRMSIVSGERIFTELERLLGLPDPVPGLKFLWETGVLRTSLDRAPLPSFATVAESLGRLKESDAVDTAVRWAVLCDLTGVDVDDLSGLLRMSTERTRDLDVLAGTTLPDHQDTPALRRLILRIGPVNVRRVVEVQRLTGALEETAAAVFLGTFDSLAATEPAEALRCPLSGADVMALLGIDPGPLVGRVRSELEALAIQQGPLSTAEAEHAARKVAAAL